MKAIYTLLILLIPFVGFGQMTYIPDDNFEQKLIDLGYDDILDDSVYTSNISSVTSLTLVFPDNVFGLFTIQNLTGIEDFENLEVLSLGTGELGLSSDIINLNAIENLPNLKSLYINGYNFENISLNENLELLHISDNYHLNELDVSFVTQLKILALSNLPNLDYFSVTQNMNLEKMFLWSIPIETINLDNNINLKHLEIDHNSIGWGVGDASHITNLDLSNNINLEILKINASGCMNLKNLNNLFEISIKFFPTEYFDLDYFNGLTELEMIYVDDVNQFYDFYYDYVINIEDNFNEENLVPKHFFQQNYTYVESTCNNYTWNGSLISNDGIYTSMNCLNEIDTLEIIFFESSYFISTCNSFTWINDVTYFESNDSIVYNLNNPDNGCDSIIFLNLIINNSSTVDYHIECDNFTWIDGITYYESNFTANQTLTNVFGCDSLVNLNLLINQSPSNQNIIGQQNVEPKSVELYSITDYGNLMEWQITGGNIVSNNNSNVTIQWGDDELGLISIYESNEFCQTTHSLEVNILQPIEGCTDESACNFNPNASVDDGSCYDLVTSISQSGDSLIANILPSNTFHYVNWYNVQEVDGINKYWLMAENSSNFMPTFDCSYFIIANDENCSDTSSVYYYAEEARSIGQLSTSPNPTNGKVKVNFDNINNQFVRLYLMNNSGNILDEFLTKNNELEIDLSSYPSGAYHITFNSPKSKGCLNEDTFQKVSNTIILNK